MKKILISGASIAGPALAYWLHRYGFETTVVEIAPELRPGGQAVDLRGAGKEVVERMGLMPEVRRWLVPEKGLAYVDGQGRRMGAMPAELFGGDGPVAEIEIMRGDLTRVLYDATTAYTEYLFNDRIVGLSEHGSGVEVTFASGLVRDFDLVVGADGIHSGVRRLAFGPEEQFVRYLGAYNAYFTVPDPGDLDGWFVMHNAPGRTVGIRPERAGTAKAMLGFAAEPLDYDRRDVQAQKQLIADLFAGMGWRTGEVLRAMWESQDFYLDTISQVKLEGWSRGRVTLLGDAACCASPLSGMGTSLAVVGAYILAGELASTPDDHAGALSRYEELMKGFVTKCHELPPGGVNGYLPRSELAIRMRAKSTKLMSVWPLKQMIAKQLNKSDGMVLKSY